jgi:hypothetical protein
VFGFKNSDDVKEVTTYIAKSKRFPSMTLDVKKRIVLHKLPPRKDFADFDVRDLYVDQMDSDDFIVRNGVNGVDTCVISAVENLEQFIVLKDYWITKVHETPINVYTKNLDEILKFADT